MKLHETSFIIEQKAHFFLCSRLSALAERLSRGGGARKTGQILTIYTRAKRQMFRACGELSLRQPWSKAMCIIVEPEALRKPEKQEWPFAEDSYSVLELVRGKFAPSR